MHAHAESISTEFWMRRRYFRWWSKFNFILSAGLDSGTVLSGLLIFLALQLPLDGSISSSHLLSSSGN